MTQSGYNINDLVQEARTRWLKPAEVFFILQNYPEDQITHEPPQKPQSGSLFLFNKRVLRFFRKDGHNWRKKRDGRTVGEAHERLKVGNAEALNCYYAHGEQNPDFQRRSFWMLDPAYEHIVLVHYRELKEGRHGCGSISQLSPGSPSTLSKSPSSYTSQFPGSTTIVSEIYEPHQSPGSVEVSSDEGLLGNGINHNDQIERKGETSILSELKVSQALRRLEEQLSLNDEKLEEIGSICYENDNSNDSDYIINDNDRYATSLDDFLMLQQESGGNGIYNHQKPVPQCTVERKDSLSWKEMLEFSTSTPAVDFQEKSGLTSDGSVGKITNQGMLPSLSTTSQLVKQERCRWINFGGHNSDNYNDLPAPYSDTKLQTSSYRKYPSTSKSHSTLPTSMLLSKEAGNFKFPVYSPVHSSNTNCYDFATIFDQSHTGMQVEADSSLLIAQKQKFTIREISPEWGYESEATKVVIVGSFLCDPLEGAWSCMLGDTEVPVQIIQEGVLCCLAPPNLPGKITLCITSGNRESCSEVREFEYRVKPSSCTHCSSSQKETTKSAEEMLLHVRFVQMLLSDPSLLKRDDTESGIGLWGKFKACEDSWSHVIEGLLVGSWTSSCTTDWLLQELLKDKLRQWLSVRSQGHDQADCSLSKKEQGIIHMVAGLGFDWAISPILNSGVGINFRDINGWTALHWAAKFGRERMVAALLASGASAGLVTDPNVQDPTGKTPASIAAANGHKGLAGYLSEMALTGHLSSLKLEENGITKSSADLEAEIAVCSISSRSLTTNEDQLSLKDTLAAVRNAAQAAARIQAAFRAHSFRRRQQGEVASAAATSVDEYSIFANDIQGISVASKLGYHNTRDTAALSIQKKFRGWKGRKDFLAFRQKVVKIQAHVRGHQVRKQYKVICWAVGVLEKVVLRWRRKGVGLRGFRQEEAIDESEDEEFLKAFRKQKVERAIDEAVSRVLSMVDSPDARQQYRRVLEEYHQAKAELEGTESEVTSASQGDISYMENEEIFDLPLNAT